MSSGSGKRRRLGYDGCGTDLIALLLVAGAALWGVHWWNEMARRPFGLARIPVPHPVAWVSRSVRGWIGSRFPQEVARTPHQPAPPRAPAPPSTPSPAAAVTEAPTPAASLPLPASLTSSPMPSLASVSPPPSPEAPVGGRAVVTALVARVQPSADPLSAPATALCERGAKLYLGLPDGGIAVRDAASPKGGSAIRPPQPAGPVRALAVSGDGATVYWLAGTSDRLFAYRIQTKTLRAFDLPPEAAPAALFDAVATLPSASGGETVALLGTRSVRFLDAASGRLRDAAEVIPAEAAEAAARPLTTLYLTADTAHGSSDRAALVELSGDGVAPGAPASVAVWTTTDARRPDAWQKRDFDAAPPYSTLRCRDSGRAAISLTASGVSLLALPAGGQTLAAGQVWTADWAEQRTAAEPTVSLRPCGTVPDGVFGLWAAPERIALGKSGLWWVFSGFVFHATHSGDSAAEAYLPWNGAGNKHIAALLADDSGAWVATDTGVRHIAPGHPAAANGYDGYVRVSLGPATGQPPASDPHCARLAQLTQEWQGTPYKWGGDARTGVDCSGYVCALYRGIGMNVPRQTGELASGSEGKRVRDELHYGDVLVYPGHCALYVGNGWTTEAMDAGVGKATVWMRKQAIVRRFLKS